MNKSHISRVAEDSHGLRNEIEKNSERLEQLADSMTEENFIYPPQISSSISFDLIPSMGIRQLVVECQVPIELVQVISSVRMELVDDKNAISNSNQAVRDGFRELNISQSYGINTHN